MKRIVLMLLSVVLLGGTADAQGFFGSRYGKATPRYGTRGHRPMGYYSDDVYCGFRVGPTFSTVSGDMSDLSANSAHSGLNVGFALGASLTHDAPLYVETGLYYTEKGGNVNTGLGKVRYNLDYLLLPLTFKYNYSPDGAFSISPFLGGYAACGVAGKVKNYATKTAHSSFDDNMFHRYDCGLRMGCGVGFRPFYAELSYDLGLANISHDDFNSAHTRSLMLTMGVNF